MSFKTITDKAFKKEVDNVIDKVLFSNFFKDVEVKRMDDEIKEVDFLTLEVEKIQDIHKDKLGSGKVTEVMLQQLKEIQKNQKERVESKEFAYQLEEQLLNEINENFNQREQDGYRRYNEQYFRDRINLFRLMDFTRDFTNEEKLLQKEVGYNVENKKEVKVEEEATTTTKNLQ